MPTGQPRPQIVLFTSAERFNIWKAPAASDAAKKMTHFFGRWSLRFELSAAAEDLLPCRGTGTPMPC